MTVTLLMRVYSTWTRLSKGAFVPSSAVCSLTPQRPNIDTPHPSSDHQRKEWLVELDPRVHDFLQPMSRTTIRTASKGVETDPLSSDYPYYSTLEACQRSQRKVQARILPSYVTPCRAVRNRSVVPLERVSAPLANACSQSSSSPSAHQNPLSCETCRRRKTKVGLL